MMRSCGVFLLTMLTLVGHLASAGFAAEPMRVLNVSMEDQFRARHETGALRGDVVVLIYAERHGAEASRDLGRRLHVRFHPTAEQVTDSESALQPVTTPAGWPEGVSVPDVRVIAVACLAEIPRAFHGIARSRFRSDSPTMPVWLDFDDTMRRSFGLVAGVPNVAILDTQGRLHTVHNGRFDEPRLAELATIIDEVRLASRSDTPRTATVRQASSR